MLSAAIAGMIQGFILCIILVISGLSGLSQLVSFEFVAAVILTALACSGLGMLTAAVSKSLDNFAAIMNFVIFPVFFLSGALYPVSTLPTEIQWITIINPFTYGVDLLKHATQTSSNHSVDFSITLDCIILALFTIFALAVSSWQFGRESTRSTLISTLAKAKN
jgi:ABC-2 type transport system permease protein